MPLTISSANMYYKDPTSGDYVGVNAVSDTSTNIIASRYEDLTFPVTGGVTHCIHEGNLYVAAQDIATTESWTAAHWTQVVIGDELGNLNNVLTAFEPSAYDATATYAVGDICWHENKMYRCNTAITTAEQWTAAHWTEIVIPKDVRVNGTSVVDANGVANVPLADNNGTPGAVILSNGNYGISKAVNGVLYICRALNNQSNSQVKAGTNEIRPIVPYTQHEAAFFGLAKAANADMASLSGVTVGVYPSAQQVAIQKMLGVYEPPFELLNDITLTEEAYIELTADSNGTPYNLREVFVYVQYPADALTASGGYGRYRFYDSDNHYANAETGKFTAGTTATFKIVHLKRYANMSMANFTMKDNIGGSGQWRIKSAYSNGIMFDLGNIVKIASPSNDVEPAGTNIKIYGQRAY